MEGERVGEARAGDGRIRRQKKGLKTKDWRSVGAVYQLASRPLSLLIPGVTETVRFSLFALKVKNKLFVPQAAIGHALVDPNTGLGAKCNRGTS